MSIRIPPSATWPSRQALQRKLGHADCGIYAEVISGGTIGAGDTIAAEQPELL